MTTNKVKKGKANEEKSYSLEEFDAIMSAYIDISANRLRDRLYSNIA